MWGSIKALFKQPYWTLALVASVVLIAAPCVSVDGHNFTTHSPNTWVLIGVGIFLLLVSIAAFAYSVWSGYKTSVVGEGLDLSRVRSEGGDLYALVNNCEIRIAFGRIESYAQKAGVAVALPCNEYFDDRCIDDTKSALGAFVTRVFDGQKDAFVSLVWAECKKRLGPGTEQQKTEDERAISFGAGRCLLLSRPLGHVETLALVSTTTQRAKEGLSAQISYLFSGMRELVEHLADSRINEVAMPMLGSGHGRIDEPLALVGLVLALAEAAHYGRGGQRLKKATIVQFIPDGQKPTEGAKAVALRALALVSSKP